VPAVFVGRLALTCRSRSSVVCSFGVVSCLDLSCCAALCCVVLLLLCLLDGLFVGKSVDGTRYEYDFEVDKKKAMSAFHIIFLNKRIDCDITSSLLSHTDLKSETQPSITL
jgi:hypothetical protein